MLSRKSILLLVKLSHGDITLLKLSVLYSQWNGFIERFKSVATAWFSEIFQKSQSLLFTQHHSFFVNMLKVFKKTNGNFWVSQKSLGDQFLYPWVALRSRSWQMKWCCNCTNKSVLIIIFYGLSEGKNWMTCSGLKNWTKPLFFPT